MAQRARQLPDGELGHVCFHGPQTFWDTSTTLWPRRRLFPAMAICTGRHGLSRCKGLHLAGRAKLKIKPSGYQVFPGDVENHFCKLEGVARCAAVGVPHPVTSEAIIAFVETQPGMRFRHPNSSGTRVACLLHAAVSLHVAGTWADAIESHGQDGLHGVAGTRHPRSGGHAGKKMMDVLDPAIAFAMA